MSKQLTPYLLVRGGLVGWGVILAGVVVFGFLLFLVCFGTSSGVGLFVGLAEIGFLIFPRLKQAEVDTAVCPMFHEMGMLGEVVAFSVFENKYAIGFK